MVIWCIEASKSTSNRDVVDVSRKAVLGLPLFKIYQYLITFAKVGLKFKEDIRGIDISSLLERGEIKLEIYDLCWRSDHSMDCSTLPPS